MNASVERTQAPFFAYVTLLNSMGAISGISLQHPRRRTGWPRLIDSEDTQDGRMIHNQMAPVGQEDLAHRYGLAKPRWHVVEGGQVPAAYQLIVVGGREVYTNGCEPQGTTWYTDGSKKGDPAGMGGATADCRAGFGLHCGPLHLIGRVRGPQTLYRAELMGMYVASCLAQGGDEVVLDNQAATDCATAAPHRQVCDVDVRQPLAEELHDKSLMPRWVPRHREERQARTIQEVRDIRGNNLSDLLASMGSELLVTPYTPDAPHGIEVGGARRHPHQQKIGLLRCAHTPHQRGCTGQHGCP